MKPTPWSYSGLDTFKTCPRKFHHEKILKDIPWVETPAQALGKSIHKAFELYQRDRTPLPASLAQHQQFMDELASAPLESVERQIGLDRQLKVCGYFDNAVIWHRCVIDFQSRTGMRRSRIVDYKTGKQHSKMLQLHLQAWVIVTTQPEIDEVDMCYYWTDTRECFPRVIMPREQLERVIYSVLPDLRQYADAHLDDTWQPRRNGLCKKYCGVKSCEHYGGG